MTTLERGILNILLLLIGVVAHAETVISDKFWIDAKEAKTLVECTQTDTTELNKKIRDAAKKGKFTISLGRDCTECEKRSFVSRGFRADRKTKLMGEFNHQLPIAGTCEIGWYW